MEKADLIDTLYECFVNVKGISEMLMVLTDGREKTIEQPQNEFYILITNILLEVCSKLDKSIEEIYTM